MGDDRAIVYVEDGIPIYRASSLGQPLRCLVAARAGNTPLEPPEYLVKAAAAGTAYEITIKEDLAEEGWVIEDEQGFVEYKVDLTGVEGATAEYAIIRGHLDAYSMYHTDDPMDDRMLEVKTMSANVHKQWTAHRFGAFETYAAQLSFYMAAAADVGTEFKPAIYAVLNRDTEELELIPIDTPPIDPTTLFEKVKSVEALNAQGIVPPCSGAKYQCAYAYMCDKSDVSPTDLKKIVDDDEVLAEAIGRYDKARGHEAEYKEIKEKAKDDIIAAMAGRSKADVGLTRVSYTSSMRKRLNTKKLRDHLGDEMDDFYDENETFTLRVTTSKGEFE